MMIEASWLESIDADPALQFDASLLVVGTIVERMLVATNFSVFTTFSVTSSTDDNQQRMEKIQCKIDKKNRFNKMKNIWVLQPPTLTAIIIVKLGYLRIMMLDSEVETTSKVR